MIDELSVTALRDLAGLFLGEMLGSGVGRTVYVLATDPSKVVKFETTAGSFQNVIEWQTWNDLQGTRVARYLAPCHWISPCGIVLVQSRVQTLPTLEAEACGGGRSLRKVQLPEFLTDLKRENYGLLDGRVVACDYGSNLAINHGACASKLRTPTWWR